jgi:hypothetical protein
VSSVVSSVESSPSSSTSSTSVEPVITKTDLIAEFGTVGWRHFINDWDGTVANSSVVNGEFVMNVTNYGNNANGWHLQILQDTIALGLPGPTDGTGVLELEPSTTYTLSFDAYASEALALSPKVYSTNDYGMLIEASVALTTTKSTFTFDFTTGTTVHGNEILKFEFGGIPTFADKTVTVAIDNVSIVDDQDAVLTSVYNGDMSVESDHTFDGAGEGAGTLVINNNVGVITVTTLGGQPYTPHYYYMVPTLAAGTYRLQVAITSSVTRDLRLNAVLPNAGWGSILPGSKFDFNVEVDTLKTVFVDFTVAAETTNVKIELDFGTLGGTLVSALGTFTLSEVALYSVE